MPPRAAKDERAGKKVTATIFVTPIGVVGPSVKMVAVTFFPLGPQPLHPGAVLERCFKGLDVKATVPPGDSRGIVVHVVLEATVAERDERLLRDPVTDRSLVGENVVEERRHVDAVGALRGGREAEREGAVEPGEDAAIARRLGVVDLVNDAVVEGRRATEGLEPLGAGQFLN